MGHSLGGKGPVRAIGIDFGTTNSAVAEVVWDPASSEPPRAQCLTVDQETLEGVKTDVLVPSVVALHAGKEWVGEDAKRLRARAPELGLRQNESLFYECKNGIGLRRTYQRAPEGYRRAAEIGGVVLRFLSEAAREQGDEPARTVVTVPASFQASQRNDTASAARCAGLELTGGDLLDEPVATFLDYCMSYLDDDFVSPGNTQRLVVFDFGGGTCDVAVFDIHAERKDGRLTIAPRGSQYASHDYQRLLKEHGLLPSMSRKGNCWDNAAMESFFRTLKTELIGNGMFRTREEARREGFAFIEVWYNRQRLHPALGYRSPEEYENLVKAL